MRIRSGPEPGDIGAVTRLHGLVYAAEYELDVRFEASVAARLVELTPGAGRARRGALDRGEGGEPVGSITLPTRATAWRGWATSFSARRRGGSGSAVASWTRLSHARARRLLAHRAHDLQRAHGRGEIYRAAGFARVSSGERSPWGRTIQMERYMLEL